MTQGKGNGANRSWTDEQVETLRKLFAEGLSFAAIATELNRKYRTSYTRCSAIGKARRVGLTVRVKASAPKRIGGGAVQKIRAARKPPREGMAAPLTWGKRPIYGGNPRTSPKQKALDAIVANTQAATTWVDRPEPAGKVTLLELEPHHCRWGIGDPSSDGFRFCGERQQGGSPYCPTHHHRAYVKPATPPKDLARSLRRYA